MDFQLKGENTTYSSSIQIAWDKQGEDLVAVGVKTDRDDEIDIIHKMRKSKHAAIEKHPDRHEDNKVLLFFERHNETHYDTYHPSFYEFLFNRPSILKYSEINAYHHNTSEHGNKKPEEVFPILSALLIDDLLGNDTQFPITIIRGGIESTRPVHWRITKLRERTDIPLVNCVEADAYYPTSLLARLLSHRIAECKSSDDSFNQLDPPVAKLKNEDRWAKAATIPNSIEYEPLSIPTAYGMTVPERISMWFNGKIAPYGTNDTRESVSEGDKKEICEYVATNAPHPSISSAFESYLTY
ncbi:hypothetical protein NKF26_23415 [Haladaptatus sp. AB618]|uniref:hypothetical protein n=1 Tax=Haladaptatus sp. AB618 TaxID=2934173 RepID=UPI00209C20DB|nr:hypothetical protein [Haladaptatus sp. AB618]MCO8256775.1 hypothetical protein [Haladaptatus sp. AB618]